VPDAGCDISSFISNQTMKVRIAYLDEPPFYYTVTPWAVPL
jgi:hypothetical protein